MTLETTPDVNPNGARLTLELTKADETYRSLVKNREAFIDNCVTRLLSSLNWASFMRIKEEFPAFMTPKREELFQQHLLRFWFFKPSGYEVALFLLRAQFHAYLSQGSYTADTDRELRNLAQKRARLVDDIARNRMANHTYERHEDPLASPRHPLNPLSPINSSSDIVWSAPLGDDCALVQEAELRESIHQQCDVRPSTPIATDDRLGYFS